MPKSEIVTDEHLAKLKEALTSLDKVDRELDLAMRKSVRARRGNRRRRCLRSTVPAQCKVVNEWWCYE